MLAIHRLAPALNLIPFLFMTASFRPSWWWISATASAYLLIYHNLHRRNTPHAIRLQDTGQIRSRWPAANPDFPVRQPGYCFLSRVNRPIEL